MRSIVNISMPKQMEELIQQEVTEGKFASKSEFFRMLIKQWMGRKSRRSARNSPTGIKVRGLKK